MKTLGLSSGLGRLSWTSSLWALATWTVLRLHEAPIAREHSICGPWGCGPPISALIAAHGFWLMVAIPGTLWAASRLPARRIVMVGWFCFGLSIAGSSAVLVDDLQSWPGTTNPAFRGYLTRHLLFTLATTVEVPLLPLGGAGFLLILVGRWRLWPLVRSHQAGEACPSGQCAAPVAVALGRASDRLVVDQPFPELALVAPDGQAFLIGGASHSHATLVYFMRAAGCSICRRHVRAIIRLVQADRLPGFGVVVIHPHGDRASRALVAALPGPVTYGSRYNLKDFDPIGFASRNFGLMHGSGTILVDSQGIVRSARLANLPFSAFDEVELLAAVAELG